MRFYAFLTFFYLALNATNILCSQTQKIVVGSKSFTEGYLLAELIAQHLESKGFTVERRFGLGGTGIVFQALQNGSIDVYPEYTGTIASALLKIPYTGKDNDILRKKVLQTGMDMTKSIGPNNTYALATTREKANKLGLSSLSHLKNYPHLRVAFGHEFFNRPDGYKGLKAFYGLDFKDVKSIEHALAYGALESDQIDLTDIYSTDAKIQSLGLQVLKDDLHFFPEYLPVVLVRKGFKTDFREAWPYLRELENSLSTEKMIELNSRVDIDKISYETAIFEFFHPSKEVQESSLFERVRQRLSEHIFLTAMAFLISFSIGFPLGILASEKAFLGKIILRTTGIVQTIPSLALLCLLIPFFGIGETTALVALGLYGLLPIVINTCSGIKSIDNKYREIACALGLSSRETLFHITIPMASPSIFAGVRTSIIISIGTAVLAALIGAGGHGVPIMRGLALNNTTIILEGAIPAALLALTIDSVLEVFGKNFIVLKYNKKKGH